MSKDTGASGKPDRATHEQSPQAVSAVPVGIPSAGRGDFDAVISVKRDTPSGGHVHLGVGRLTVGENEESAVGIEIAHPGAPDGVVTCFALRLPTFAVLLDCMTECFTIAQAIEARRAETGTGSVHESAVGETDAPDPSSMENSRDD